MPPGRTRDMDARERLLDAAFDLVGERGTANVSIADIASRAGVGRQTIYRWWQSKNELVLDALLERTLEQTPFPSTEDPRADFRSHLRQVVVLFSSPSGAVIRELVGGAQSDPELAQQFLDRFWAPRRVLSRARLDAAIRAGDVRPGLDAESVLDALYAPLWLRLLLGHRPLRKADADRIVDAVWSGISA